jgi:hypothetical protein
VYELGTGRAVANARREADETARTLAAIRELEARFAAAALTRPRIEAAA